MAVPTKQVLFIQGAGEGAYDEDALLARSLQDALGDTYVVRYPRMPNDGDAEYPDWKQQIASELAVMDGERTLVGHSVGGSVLIKYLSEATGADRIAGLFLLAAPFWEKEGFWKWDEARLENDVAEKLSYVPRICLYHSRDDETVPFEHLASYAALLPHATIREVEGRGHQFGNDLTDVARDIRSGT
jgi:uncharacterized protein